MSEVNKIWRAHSCGALLPNIAGFRPAYNKGMLACLNKFVKNFNLTTLFIQIIYFSGQKIQFNIFTSR